MIKKLFLSFCSAVAMGIPSIAKASKIVHVTPEEFKRVAGEPGRIIVEDANVHRYYAVRDGIFFSTSSQATIPFPSMNVIKGTLAK